MFLNPIVPIDSQGLRSVPDPEQQRQTRLVPCPTCSGESVYAESNPFRPFCSARCKNTDFGAWAGGGFRVPAGLEPEQRMPGDASLQ